MSGINILTIIGIIAFLYFCALVYDRNNKINQLKEEKLDLQRRIKSYDKESEYLREELKEKEKECKELRNQFNQLAIILNSSDNNKNANKETHSVLREG